MSHNNCSVKRAEKILELVKSDGGSGDGDRSDAPGVWLYPYDHAGNRHYHSVEYTCGDRKHRPFSQCKETGEVRRNRTHQFFFSGKREGHVPETGKPEITGIFLLSCNPDGAGSSQRNAEECVIS